MLNKKINRLCRCGRPGKYAHINTNGQEVYGCNKYQLCLTYNEQLDKIKDIGNKLLIYEQTLKNIVNINAMTNSYKIWAKNALLITGII